MTPNEIVDKILEASPNWKKMRKNYRYTSDLAVVTEYAKSVDDFDISFSPNNADVVEESSVYVENSLNNSDYAVADSRLHPEVQLLMQLSKNHLDNIVDGLARYCVEQSTVIIEGDFEDALANTEFTFASDGNIQDGGKKYSELDAAAKPVARAEFWNEALEDNTFWELVWENVCSSVDKLGIRPQVLHFSLKEKKFVMAGIIAASDMLDYNSSHSVRDYFEVT